MVCRLRLDIPEGLVARDFALSLLYLAAPGRVEARGEDVEVDMPDCDALLDVVSDLLGDPCRLAGSSPSSRRSVARTCSAELPHASEFEKLGAKLRAGVRIRSVNDAIEALRRLSRGETIDSPRVDSRPLIRAEYREYARGFGGAVQGAAGSTTGRGRRGRTHSVSVIAARSYLPVSIHAQLLAALGYCATLAAFEGGGRTHHLLVHRGFSDALQPLLPGLHAKLRLLYRRYIQASNILDPSVYLVAASALVAAEASCADIEEGDLTLPVARLTLKQRSATLDVLEEAPLGSVYRLLCSAQIDVQTNLLEPILVLWDAAMRGADQITAILNRYANSLLVASITGSTDYLLAAERVAFAPLVSGSEVLHARGSTCLERGACICASDSTLPVGAALDRLVNFARMALESLLARRSMGP
ncbi:hypothetical protein Pyrfu_0432 [Pyrolobus fumarii 1A]|uniref:Uncharacterized protein n=1 Tax=Pyrolobus fumarii (strain DSM 11204 / 1A) TaxID=694429 RepID=G0EG55_PYRF1|nr:hypothetical protein [Pyrolobus fumarii]AEM38303.1 hypothetical protein Pyrfu_0432 [Pyrolobus fumarii 1A]